MASGASAAASGVIVELGPRTVGVSGAAGSSQPWTSETTEAPSPVADATRFIAKVLTGFPSILAGVFVYAWLVVAMGTYSAIAGGVALAVLMLPTIMLTSEQAIRMVPQRMKDAGFTVLKVDNVEERVTSPVVRGNKREEPSMTLVASYYENVTLDFDERVDGSVDLLLGSEKPEPVKKPLKEVETGGSICVAPTTTPSPSPSASQEP